MFALIPAIDHIFLFIAVSDVDLDYKHLKMKNGSRFILHSIWTKNVRSKTPNPPVRVKLGEFFPIFWVASVRTEQSFHIFHIDSVIRKHLVQFMDQFIQVLWGNKDNFFLVILLAWHAARLPLVVRMWIALSRRRIFITFCFYGSNRSETRTDWRWRIFNMCFFLTTKTGKLDL